MSLQFSTRKINNARTIVYLQNTGQWNGRQFSSTILSCTPKKDEVESYLNRAVTFINKNYKDAPIRWHDMLTNKLLGPESVEGEMIGNFFREKCSVIDDLLFQGGHIFGGKTGDKYIEEPILLRNNLPLQMDTPTPIIMTICKFNGDHQCNIQYRKGSVEDIRQYQNSIVSDVLLKNEKQTWETSSFIRKDEILAALQRIDDKLNDA